jgi:hypothetical protein
MNGGGKRQRFAKEFKEERYRYGIQAIKLLFCTGFPLRRAARIRNGSVSGNGAIRVS